MFVPLFLAITLAIPPPPPDPGAFRIILHTRTHYSILLDGLELHPNQVYHLHANYSLPITIKYINGDRVAEFPFTISVNPGQIKTIHIKIDATTTIEDV